MAVIDKKGIEEGRAGCRLECYAGEDLDDSSHPRREDKVEGLSAVRVNADRARARAGKGWIEGVSLLFTCAFHRAATSVELPQVFHGSVDLPHLWNCRRAFTVV